MKTTIDLEHENPVTKEDVICYALGYALRSKIISQSEHDNAKASLKRLVACCELVVAYSKGPTNSNPTIEAGKTLAELKGNA